MNNPPVFSPVDYDAWNRGYIPPSEHRLIHALQFEDAKVVASSNIDGKNGWWIVTQGEPFDDEDSMDLMMLCTERQLARAKRRLEEKRAKKLAAKATADTENPPESASE